MSLTVVDVSMGVCCGKSATDCPHCLCCGQANVDGGTDFCDPCKEHDGWCLPLSRGET